MAAPEDFDRLASERPPGIVREFVAYLAENKKWWLLPIIITLALIGLLIVLGSSGAAPFIYPLI